MIFLNLKIQRNKNCIVEVKNICMTYNTFNGETKALRNIDLKVYEGEIVGVVDSDTVTEEELGLMMAGAMRGPKAETAGGGGR